MGTHSLAHNLNFPIWGFPLRICTRFYPGRDLHVLSCTEQVVETRASQPRAATYYIPLYANAYNHIIKISHSLSSCREIDIAHTIS